MADRIFGFRRDCVSAAGRDGVSREIGQGLLDREGSRRAKPLRRRRVHRHSRFLPQAPWKVPNCLTNNRPFGAANRGHGCAYRSGFRGRSPGIQGHETSDRCWDVPVAIDNLCNRPMRRSFVLHRGRITNQRFRVGLRAARGPASC